MEKGNANNMTQQSPPTSEDLPRAKIRKQKRTLSVIWVVPIVAALVAGYLVFKRVREYGKTVTICFHDVEGVKPGQTTVQYRGAAIGKVSSIELDRNQQFALVKIKLRRSAASLAREGTVFWIVRPQIGMGNLTGLGTIITGPYIAVAPGRGKESSKFTGAEDSPTMFDPDGLKVIVLSAQRNSLRAGVPIYYRGIEVGTVQKALLSSNATTVEIHCVIRHGYAGLVHQDSKFWNVTGLDVRVGLFSGAEINVESLKSLLMGGLAFATPGSTNSRPAKSEMIYRLYDKPEAEWLRWSPEIAITPEGIDRELIDETPTQPVPQGNN